MSFLQRWFFNPQPVEWLQHLIGLGYPLPFRLITQLGTTWGVIFVLGLALWMWGRRTMYALVGIVVLEAALSFALNRVLHVPRPDATGIVKYERISVGSFPSGHVFVTTVLWGLLYALGRIPLLLAALAVVGVAVARLYLGVHYLVDVVAGALFGVLLVWAFVKLWPGLQRWFAERSFGFFLILGLLALGGAVATIVWLAGSNPFVWNSAGLVAGAAVALLLESRYVRYTPSSSAGVEQAAAKIGIGFLGLLPLAFVDRFTGENNLVLGAAMVALGALWALLLAPALFVRMGLSEEWSPSRGSSTWAAGEGIGVTFLGGLALLLIYGMAIEPRLILDVEEQAAPITNLPPEWEGQKVAALADFQLGMWGANRGVMERAIDEAIQRRPAAVLLLGDYIYQPQAVPTELVAEVAGLLRPLAESGIPTFAVLGNHDWALDVENGTINPTAARMVEQVLDSLGIRVLHNEAVPLARDAAAAPRAPTPLYLVGIGSEWAKEDDPRAAVDEVPSGAPRIVFMHNPDSFPEIPAGAAPLAVAAHTHGGQIRIPFTPSWSWVSIVSEGEPRVDGWIAPDYGAPGNRLYVNRGIGFSDVPIRINCAPELTMFTLQRAPVTGTP